MYFRILHDETGGELTYLLADMDAREAVLIDPRACDLALLQALLAERDLRLRWILRTHQHDNLNQQEPIHLARLSAPLIQGTVAHGAQVGTDGQILPFGDELVRILATPGHTAGCLSFAWRDRLFCGGLLAVDGCPDQATPSDPEALWDSVVQRIFTLADETLLFSGHERCSRAVSTVLEQRRSNPFFAGRTRDEFLARASAIATPSTSLRN